MPTNPEIYVTSFTDLQTLWEDKLLISEQNKVISLFLPGLDFCFAVRLWWENTDVEPGTTACSSKSDSGIVAQPPSRKGKDLHVVFL